MSQATSSAFRIPTDQHQLRPKRLGPRGHRASRLVWRRGVAGEFATRNDHSGLVMQCGGWGVVSLVVSDGFSDGFLQTSNLYLVGGFKHFSIIYGMSSFPLTNSYFLRWLKPPTSYISCQFDPICLSFHVSSEVSFPWSWEAENGKNVRQLSMNRGKR